MSLAMLERAAREPAPFLDEVAFLGGATVVLVLSFPGHLETSRIGLGATKREQPVRIHA